MNDHFADALTAVLSNHSIVKMTHSILNIRFGAHAYLHGYKEFTGVYITLPETARQQYIVAKSAQIPLVEMACFRRDQSIELVLNHSWEASNCSFATWATVLLSVGKPEWADRQQ